MIAAHTLQETRFRLARYYQGKLRGATETFKRGSQHAGAALAQLDSEWAHVNQWWTWSAGWSTDDMDRARLCADYTLSNFPVLRLRLPAHDLLAWLRRSLEAAQRLRNAAWERELLHYITVTHIDVENLDQAVPLATQLVQISQAAADALGQARGLLHLAAINTYRGRFDEAENQLQQAQILLDKIPADIEHAILYLRLANIAAFRGDYRAAHDLHLKQIAIVETQGNLLALNRALGALSGISLFLGEGAAAEQYAHRAVEICRTLGNPLVLIPSFIVLAHAEKNLGQYESACQHYEEGVNAMRIGAAASTLVNGLYGWAQANVFLGQVQRALQLYAEALGRARDAGLPYRVCEVAADMALVLSIQHDPDSARTALKECVRQAQFLKTARYHLMAIGAAVVFAQARGDAERAARWAGVVHERPEYVERLGIFKRTSGQLQAALGADVYEVLLAQGKGLAFETALAEIIHQLDE
jgi:tetratricopeptide (TPR) repeat protein